MIVQGGVYKTADLYTYKGHLYIAASGGYVRVYETGATTKDKLMVRELHTDVGLSKDVSGRLVVTSEYEGKQKALANPERLMIT